VNAEIDNEGNKMPLPSGTTYTLLEADDGQVVVGVLTVQTLAPRDSPTREKPKTRGSKATLRQKDANLKEMEVAGKKLACHRTEVKGVAGSVKSCVSAEVAGVVKKEVGPVSKSIQRLAPNAWEKK
jgi:hypothetical protein